jgi:hypothetical protein
VHKSRVLGYLGSDKSAFKIEKCMVTTLLSNIFIYQQDKPFENSNPRYSG